MICDKVGRKAIEALKVGEIGIYTLPDERARECARVQFCQMKRLTGMDFEKVSMEELKNMLGDENFKQIVPCERLTVAYRKTKDSII